MYGRGTARLTLMCRDHESLIFSWDRDSSRVVGRLEVLDVRYAPYGARDALGRPTRSQLGHWLRDRSVPSLRPHAERRFRELGYTSSLDALASGYGLSLSDQYWLKPEGASVTWSDVSCFTNDFPEELGRYLLPHAPNSEPSLSSALRNTPHLVATSPDTSLGGNLSKRWEMRDGIRQLVKGGRATYFQQPFNELVATRLCERLGIAHVSYELEMGDGLAQWYSICPCMVDDTTEFVPAYQLRTSHQKANDRSLRDYYVGLASAHGIEVGRAVEQMLSVDYLLANCDRHWNNFGVLIDTESRRWLSPAPLFDTGESLWCDRTVQQGFGGYNLGIPDSQRPFLMEQDEQLPRFCTNLSWFNPHALDGFVDEAISILEENPLLHVEKGRIDGVANAMSERVARFTKHAARCQA